MSKIQRRQSIVELIAQGQFTSQEELAEALSERGFSATQATVSRDLRELGVVKGSMGYLLPDALVSRPVTNRESTGISDSLHTAIRNHVVRATPAGTLVVLRTAPGHANVVAVELDRRPPTGVIGTIAGDDTIFLATASQGQAQALVNTIAQIAGLKH